MDKKEKKEKDLIKKKAETVPSTIEDMEKMMAHFIDEAMRYPFSLFGRHWWPRMQFPEKELMSPSADIYREGNNIVVKTELPGMTKEDIDITLTDDKITISGEKKREEKVEEKDYYRYERSSGSFSRSFRLPEEVQTDKVKASFKNGILEIKIPMTEEARKKEKKIKIE